MPPELVVVWRVTAACDLACLFCGYSRELARPRRQVRAADALRFGGVLAEWQAATGRSVLVSWLGGEPLLWPPLWAVSTALRARGLRLSVTTNGTRLDAQACAQLARDFAQVTVSVDGPAAWHEQIRGAPGLYARVRAGVLGLAEARARCGGDLLIRVNTILMRSNMRAFEALGAALAEWGVTELTFNTLGGADRGGPFYAAERLRPEDVAEFSAALPAVRARLAERGLHVRGSARYLERLAAQAQDQAWPVAECAPGRSFLFADEAGRVAPCAFTLNEFGRPLAALRTPADIEQLAGDWSDAQRRHAPPPCADCRSTQVFEKFALSETRAPAGWAPVTLSEP